ncbi:MAG TPA: tetratricopeptide repeat protein, partial [Phototrophicaceae bacterium]|nr:tetratricopeptide repeat protein [Phototrophicaceae bacterium]
KFMLQNIMPQITDELLILCAGAAVLEFVDGHWRFTHDKIRETVLSDLTAAERPGLYRDVASTTAHIYPNNPDLYRRLADLYHEAGDEERELHFLQRALDHALTISTYYQASALAERTLHLLPDTPTNTAERVRLMIHFAQAKLGIRDWQPAYDLLIEALTLANTLNDLQLKSMCLSRLGYLENYRGHFDEGRDYLNQALDAAERSGYTENIGPCQVFLARIARGEGDFTSADALYAQASFNCEAAGNQPMLSEALNGRGWIALFRGEAHSAQGHFEKSLAVSRKIGNRDLESTALGNLGMVYLLLEDYVASEPFVLKGLELSRDVDDTWGVAWGHHCLGDIYWMLERYPEALEQYEIGYGLYKSIENNTGMVFCIGGRGNVYLRLGEFDTARVLLREALTLACSHPELMFVMWSLIGVAEWFVCQGDHIRAAGLLHRVIAHSITEQWHRARAVRLLQTLPEELREVEPDDLATPLDILIPNLLVEMGEKAG